MRVLTELAACPSCGLGTAHLRGNTEHTLGKEARSIACQSLVTKSKAQGVEGMNSGPGLILAFITSYPQQLIHACMTTCGILEKPQLNTETLIAGI